MSNTSDIEKIFHRTSPYEKFPLENYEKEISGWHNESPVFEELLKEINPEIFLEVGTWLGASAIHISGILEKMESSCPVLCIDTWLGSEEFSDDVEGNPRYDALRHKHGFPSVYYQFIANVIHASCQNRIIPVPQTSQIGARILTKHNLHPDLIYLDGSHQQTDVWNDLEAYWKLLKAGGIIFGDDYDEHWPGLIQSVNEFACSKDTQIETRDCFWILRKKEAESGKSEMEVLWNADLSEIQKYLVALQTENAVLRARLKSVECENKLITGEKNRSIRDMNIEKHHLIGLIHKQKEELKQRKNC